MTSSVLNQSKTDNDGNVYFDDFVGNGDLDAENRTVVSETTCKHTRLSIGTNTDIGIKRMRIYTKKKRNPLLRSNSVGNLR